MTLPKHSLLLAMSLCASSLGVGTEAHAQREVIQHQPIPQHRYMFALSYHRGF